MTPILYESDEKDFWSKGLGPLSDAEKCTVTEERNGAYTLSMAYPIDGAQADKIANNRIIKADNAYDLKNQLFVIKTVTPIMTETGEISLSVYAEHISYITNDLSIPPELSLTGTAQQALDQWKDSLIGGDTSGITVDSDVTNTSSTLLSIQNVANARQALGGVEGSILYCWKGEYKFDNLHISLKKQRGTTANTLLSYGRNLLTFEQEQNIAETYTTLYPYALVTAAGGMIQKLVTIDGYLVDSKYVSHYPNRKIKTHDFTSDFQNYRIGAKPSENAEEGVTYADLATIKKYLKGKALHFMTTNDIGVPKISTTITFADLSKTDDELAKFEKLSLCDKVPVRFEKLGINSTIKVTRTVWNVLTDSYDSIELGDLNATIGETVASVSAETSAIKTKVNQASMTAQIAADGTHNIFRTDDETEPIAKKVGDLWYKTDGKYTSMYQWDGKAWVLIINTRDTADVRTELDQAKSDMAQAKTDAQTAYDEAIKATGTANGAKAQTDEALKQAKQANDSYTALAKEVADNKSSADADYQKAQADMMQAQKDLASVTDTVTEVKKGQGELSTKIAGKVDNTVYQTYVKQTNQALSEKLVSSDLNGYAKTVDVTKSINGVKTTVADNAGKIATMQTDVNGIKTNVKNAQGDISSLQTDAKSIKATVSDHTGKITQLTTDVNGVKSSVSSKVDKTTYQSYVAQTDKALSAKLTASDLKGYAKTADVKQTTDGLSASITKVQGNLAYQASELIGKKSFEDRSVGEWTCNDFKTKAVISNVSGYSAYGYTKCICTPNNNDLYWNVDCKVNPGDKYYVELLVPNFYSVHGGRAINVRGLFRYTKDGKTAWQAGPSGQVAGNTTGWIKGIITVPDGITSVKPCISVKDNGVTCAVHLTYASFVKLDDYTQSQLDTLSGKITATSDRLSSVYTKSETDAKLKTKVEQSVLTQTSNNLSASITKNSKILSSAGLVNDNAYINANRIALNGKTLMTNATINDAFIGSLSANKITTGTLNAAKVNLINVNASNISTGVLNGIKITSTGKDPSGTSSTTNIQSGYIDTNVINCSDYILVGKADADPRKRWQTKQDKWGMWFQTPAKLNGHTGNAPSDWQSEWQGFIRGDGWNYQTATVTGNGASGIAVAITPQQIWGRPYGGDYFQIGVWEPSYGANSVDGKKFENGWCSPRFVIDVTGQLTGHPHSITLGDTEDYTGTYNHGNLNILDGNLHVKPVYANHGIRTAWVSWSDWGSNQKIPCIVQDKDNWGGIAFPANGRVVLFTHGNRINTDGLPKDKVGSYNGWGN